MSQEFQLFPKTTDIWAAAPGLQKKATEAGVDFDVANIVALLDKKERLLEEIPLNPPSARLWKSSTTLVGVGATVAFAFNTRKWDTTENNRMTRDMSLGRIYAPTRGVYLVGGSLEYALSITTPFIGIRINGGALVALHTHATGRTLSTEGQWRANANDYFDMVTAHGDGVARNVDASDPFSPAFYVTWLRV